MSYSICIDIGGTRLKMGVIADGELIEHKIIEIQDHSSLKSILEILEEEIIHLKEKHLLKGPLEAIGMSLPSFVDSEKNEVLSQYVKYTDAGEMDLVDWSMRKFGVPIFIENDARAALMGEAFHGAGKGYKDLVMVTFGTGIGSAVMLNGKLLKGKDFFAGNLIGHSVIDYDGGQCNCGGIGCLESVASSWALERTVSSGSENIDLKKPEEKIDYKYIFKAAQNGDVFYTRILENTLDAWGKMMINLVLAYNPDCIICAGGIMNAGEMVLDSFRKTIDQHGWISSENVKLLKAKNTDFAALFGLSEIIQQNLKTKKV